MQHRLVYMIIMTLLSLSACSKPELGEIYFPKGSDRSEWKYAVRFSTPQGVHMGEMSVLIDGEETINGRTYYKQTIIKNGVPDAGTRVSYIRRAKEGIYKRYDNTITSQEYLTTPFPIMVGIIWKTKTLDGLTLCKAEKIENIEVNDKIYLHCLKIYFQTYTGSQTFEGISYYAPGIGEVYSLLNYGGLKVDFALTNYKL